MNLIDGAVSGSDAIELQGGLRVPVPSSARGLVRDGQKVQFGFRADNLMPEGHSVQAGGETAELELEVTLTEPLGTETILFTDIAGYEVQAKMLNPRPVRPGERLKFQLMLDKCHVFDTASSDAIRG
jgi:multiple sugar transport system ATP-binding protein